MLEQISAIFYRIDDKTLPENSFLLINENAKKILLSPWISGLQLKALARESCKDFLKTLFIHSKSFAQCRPLDAVEIVPLAGALYYDLAGAFASVFEHQLQMCFVGAKRYLKNGIWDTRTDYFNFEAMPVNPFILIGDTIATGGTIVRLLENILESLEEIRGLAIFTICGAREGGKRLNVIEETVRDKGGDFYIVYANAAFGLEENGTDMPWLHKDTITLEKLSNEARKVYGNLGDKFCAVWDWGQRAKSPIAHLKEFLGICIGHKEKAINAGDLETVNILNAFIAKTEKEIEELHQGLST
ncbi:MAG: hypothetical protein ACXAEU_14870 [Candidatus Hodarchaeales archaeon]|jgi:hypothetical protein